MATLPPPPLTAIFRVYLLPENLRLGGTLRKNPAAATRRKTPEGEKLSGRQDFARGNSLSDGEIVAIVTSIALDFIGVIIISTTRTFITAITTSSRCDISGWIFHSS
jgi:hypothetical protein